MLSFETDIRPLFRTKDRDSMLAAFDLFDYASDGAWPAEQVDKLQQWIDAGKPA
jgi:hypothetical protein